MTTFQRHERGDDAERKVRWLIAFVLLSFEAVLVVWLSYSIAVRGVPPPSLNLSPETRRAFVDVKCPPPGTDISPFQCHDAIQDSDVERVEARVKFWQGVRPSPRPLVEVYVHGKPRPVALDREDWWDGKFPDVIDAVNKIVLMSFGVFVIARGRGRLALLAGLALYGLAAGSGIRPALIDMSAGPVIAIHVVRQFFLVGGLFCLTLMSVEMLRSASPEGSLPPVQATRINTLLIVAVLINLVVLWGSIDRGVVYPLYHTLNLHPEAPSSGYQWWRLRVFLAPALAMILPICLMYAAVTRASRSNAGLYRWIFASTALGLSGTIIWLLYSTFTKAPQQVHDLVLTELMMGAGYAYAIVRHRLVDVAFVINRGVVLAIAAVVVAAIVVLIDDKIDPIIKNWPTSHQQFLSFWSLGLQVFKYALILAVGLSLRFLESPIELLIDRLLFARRYRIKEGLATLQTIANSAETPDHLIRLVTSRLRGLIEARSVALYEPQGETLIPTYVDAVERTARAGLKPLNDDDETIRQIRTTLVPTEAHGRTTTLPDSAVAFPMALADHFTGAVVVERQSAADPYDPDLRAMIGKFVRDFAAALLYLRSPPAQVPYR